MAEPRPFIGLMAGIAAGLVASAAMAAFEAGAATLLHDGEDEGSSGSKTGPTGESTRYIVGAVMGGIYGMLTEYRPEASAGFGSAYGIATSTLLDEAALTSEPATLADEAPERIGAHLVFGIVLEGVRRLIGGRR